MKHSSFVVALIITIVNLTAVNSTFSADSVPGVSPQQQTPVTKKETGNTIKNPPGYFTVTGIDSDNNSAGSYWNDYSPINGIDGNVIAVGNLIYFAPVSLHDRVALKKVLHGICGGAWKVVSISATLTDEGNASVGLVRTATDPTQPSFVKIVNIVTKRKDVLALVNHGSVTINIGENGLTATIEGVDRTIVLADSKQLELYLSVGKKVIGETK